MNYTLTQLKKIAESRTRLHAGRAQHRVWGDKIGEINWELLGVLGEAAFASYFDVEIDEKRKRGGDGGVDFHTLLGTVDVKAASSLYGLKHDLKKPLTADFYFLAVLVPNAEEPYCRLVGFATREELEKAEVRKSKSGLVKMIPVKSLHPAYAFRKMWEIRDAQLAAEGR